MKIPPYNLSDHQLNQGRNFTAKGSYISLWPEVTTFMLSHREANLWAEVTTICLWLASTRFNRAQIPATSGTDGHTTYNSYEPIKNAQSVELINMCEGNSVNLTYTAVMYLLTISSKMSQIKLSKICRIDQHF